MIDDSTPGFPAEDNEYELLREEISPRLCLPATVEPVCLTNEADTKSDNIHIWTTPNRVWDR